MIEVDWIDQIRLKMTNVGWMDLNSLKWTGKNRSGLKWYANVTQMKCNNNKRYV